MDPNSERLRNEDEGTVKPPEGGGEVMPSSDPNFGEQIETPAMGDEGMPESDSDFGETLGGSEETGPAENSDDETIL